MKKLELELPQLAQIEINGDIFSIYKSDVDILNKSRELTDKYGKIKENDKSAKNIKLITDGANEIISYIDEILGTGAVALISKGLPVSITMACGWLTEICRTVTGNIDDYVAENY